MRSHSPLWPLFLFFFSFPSAHAQQAVDRVEIRYVPPTLAVEARVNGSGPMLFAFDTGTTTIILDTRVAERLGIARRWPARHAGQDRVARARSLAVGKGVAYDLEVVLRDLSPLARRLGLPLAGILGYTWMEQFVFEIDYAAGELTLWPRQAELSASAGTLVVPLEIRTGPGFTGASAHVAGQLNGAHCRFEIDTGTDTGILGAVMAEQLGAHVRSGEQPVSGIGWRTLPTHQVQTLTLGGRLFANVTFEVDPARGAEGEPYRQCVIGNEQLREFVLTLDFPHRRAFFRPAPVPAAPR